METLATDEHGKTRKGKIRNVGATSFAVDHLLVLIPSSTVFHFYYRVSSVFHPWLILLFCGSFFAYLPSCTSWVTPCWGIRGFSSTVSTR